MTKFLVVGLFLALWIPPAGSATYDELFAILSSRIEGAQTLRNRVTIAVALAAEKIRTEPTTTPDHVTRLIWAKTALVNPGVQADKMLMAILAAHHTLPQSDLLKLSDTQIQTAVDNTLALLVTTTREISSCLKK